MAESLALTAASELTPRGGGASAGDGSGSLSKRGKGAGHGQSRAKDAQQKEHIGVLSKPVVRRHVMKDLTKVYVITFPYRTTRSACVEVMVDQEAKRCNYERLMMRRNYDK